MTADRIWPTAMETWPDPLFDFCLPHTHLALSQDDIACFLDLARRRKPDQGAPPALPGSLVADLDRVIATMPEGAHVRLGLCSFKHGTGVPRFHGGGDLGPVLARAAPRVRSVLQAYLHAEREAGLFVFPWVEVPHWSEFRLFIRDRQLVGVSQYHHQTRFTGLSSRIDDIAAALSDLAARLIPALHMDWAVADVFVVPRADGGFDPVLIEINPFVRRTDPCLYSWRGGGDFDGRLRFHAG